MFIVNGLQESKTFFRSDGSPIQVKRGTISGPEVTTPNLIKAIMDAGPCDKIGVVITTEYEYGIATKSYSGCIPYIHPNIETAKAKLLEGKTFVPVTSNEDAAHALKIECDKKDLEIEKLHKQLNKAESDAAQAAAQLDPLKEKIDDMTKKLATAELDLKNEQESRTNLSNQVQQLNTENENYIQKVKTLTETISAKDEEINSLKSDIEKLKEEGQKLVNNHQELRDILNDLVEEYHLVRTDDGKWRIPEAKDEAPAPQA